MNGKLHASLHRQLDTASCNKRRLPCAPHFDQQLGSTFSVTNCLPHRDLTPRAHQISSRTTAHKVNNTRDYKRLIWSGPKRSPVSAELANLTSASLRLHSGLNMGEDSSRPPTNRTNSQDTKIHPLHFTPFDELPNKKQVWPSSPGSREEGLGRLVLITSDIVASAAASCVRSGRRVSLGWELNKLEIANFGRLPCKHEIVGLLDGAAFDDIYTFNPQQSSQWDGLRHFSQPTPTEDDPKRRLFYGGVTKEEIMDPTNHRIGMQHWAKEGICGRGVLLDYVAYAEKKGIEYSTFSDHSIPLNVLLEIAQEENVTFRQGDILFVRVGVTKEWDTKMTADDKNEYATTMTPQHAGVEGTEEMLRWLWNSRFAAVASDAISFEVYPPKKSYPRGEGQEVEGRFLHEYLLAGWGMPIGELFDLEALSALCVKMGRWEFFVASAVFNMPGGVSSPGNCIAIF